MKYPALADKIIDVLKGDIWMTPAQVATTINEGSEKVRLTMREMASLKSFWFEIQTDPKVSCALYISESEAFGYMVEYTIRRDLGSTTEG